MTVTRSPKYHRADYEAIAGALRGARTRSDTYSLARIGVDQVEDELVALFQCDNPDFDPARFRKAARLDEDDNVRLTARPEDARIIAAAPQMLAALLALTEAFEVAAKRDPLTFPEQVNALAVIAAARGQA
jgi:hypothetical protein